MHGWFGVSEPGGEGPLKKKMNFYMIIIFPASDIHALGDFQKLKHRTIVG